MASDLEGQSYNSFVFDFDIFNDADDVNMDFYWPGPAEKIQDIDCTPSVPSAVLDIDGFDNFAGKLASSEYIRSDFDTLQKPQEPSFLRLYEEYEYAKPSDPTSMGELIRENQNMKRKYEEVKSELEEQKKMVKRMTDCMSEELSCSICGEYMVSPQLIKDCGHSFCAECLTKWIHTMKKNLCPQCRMKVTNKTKATCPVYKLSSVIDAWAENVLPEEEKAEYKERQKTWENNRNRPSRQSTPPRRTKRAPIRSATSPASTAPSSSGVSNTEIADYVLRLYPFSQQQQGQMMLTTDSPPFDQYMPSGMIEAYQNMSLTWPSIIGQ